MGPCVEDVCSKCWAVVLRCLKDYLFCAGLWLGVGEQWAMQWRTLKPVSHTDLTHPLPCARCLAPAAAAEAQAQAAEVARLQREAEARRSEAGQAEQEAARKKTEVETVALPAVPEKELLSKAKVGSGSEAERWAWPKSEGWLGKLARLKIHGMAT